MRSAEQENAIAIEAARIIDCVHEIRKILHFGTASFAEQISAIDLFMQLLFDHANVQQREVIRRTVEALLARISKN